MARPLVSGGELLAANDFTLVGAFALGAAVGSGSTLILAWILIKMFGKADK